MVNLAGQSGDLLFQDAGGSCPAALDMLKTGIICCFLDKDMTFQWGNSGFFSSIGHSRESFHSSFCSLRQYYAALPDEFELIRSELTKADEGGRCDIGMTVRLPQREGGHAWANLS